MGKGGQIAKAEVAVASRSRSDLFADGRKGRKRKKGKVEREKEGYSEGEDLFEDQSASFPGFAQLRKRAKLDVTDFYSTETRTFSDSFLH